MNNADQPKRRIIPARIPSIDEKIIMINAYLDEHKDTRIGLHFDHDTHYVTFSTLTGEHGMFEGRDWHDCLDWIIRRWKINAQPSPDQKQS